VKVNVEIYCSQVCHKSNHICTIEAAFPNGGKANNNNNNNNNNNKGKATPVTGHEGP
jgi:hypothetical protein